MNLAHKHVLVIDDNSINTDLLLDLLEDHDFNDAHALNDPREALDYCQRRMPDLILLDIRMPHLDGYALINQLQDAFHHAMPPVIVLTAQIDDATRHRALSMGVRDFITKPFKHDEVLQRICNTLSVEHRYLIRDQQAETLEGMVAKRTAQLEQQSCTDPITQLPNRRSLKQSLQRAASDQQEVGLIFVALDQLDDIIRLHGYRVADQLIRHISQSIGTMLDTHCELGMWGGSELLIITHGYDHIQLGTLAEQVLHHFDHDQAIGDLLLPVKARLGLSSAEGYFEPERLVHKAALALPANGSRRIQRYDASLETQQRERLHLQQAIRCATERGEMSLAYQPKLSLITQKIIGAEALLRWHHPELGMVSPATFIPLAEASGDILAIGDWVLEEAIKQAIEWRRTGLLADDFHIAVNVAARQLALRQFADGLLGILERYQLPPRFLSVEVTESGLMGDMQRARQQLDKLAEAGIAVAIDDFGTGHSSLAYIKTLPFKTLKIDRAFIMGVEDDPVDRQLARTITELAHAVGCDVVAEGIETQAQAAYLHSIGCEVAQGYYYARPLPAADFVAFCQQWVPFANESPGLEPVNGA